MTPSSKPGGPHVGLGGGAGARGQLVWVIHAFERGRRVGTTVYRSRAEAAAALTDEAANSRDDGLRVEVRPELGELEIWEPGDRARSILYVMERVAAASVRRATSPRPRYADPLPGTRPRLP